MIAPAIAAIRAMTANTEVRDGGLAVLVGVMTSVAVCDILARAVRVSRMYASCVDAPGDGDNVVSPVSGVIVVV
jgi:hypothetical protein